MLDWMTAARCAHADPELFFPKPRHHRDAAEAKAICAACPVIGDCLAYALGQPNLYGIWGGTTADERQGLRRRSHPEAGKRSRRLIA